MYAGGQWELCLVTGFNFSKGSGSVPPLAEVVVVSGSDDDDGQLGLDRRMIDLGQLTTLWSTPGQGSRAWGPSGDVSLEDVVRKLGAVREKAVESLRTDFPVNFGENAMQNLYNSRVGRGRTSSTNSGNTLTKKKIKRISSEASTEEIGARVGEILRKVAKAGGPGMPRLVDSSAAVEHLYEDYAGKDGIEENIKRRIVGAELLALDANLGGRFKRHPCAFVSTDFVEDGLASVTVVNGGWAVVDLSVRAVAEARKFAERTTAVRNGDGSGKTLTSENTKESGSSVRVLTAADERIARRLECLAMGEALSEQSRRPGRRGTRNEDAGGGYQLELDVREALRSLLLPETPEGAREALVKLGRWSEGQEATKGRGLRIEPWSQETMDAARFLVRHEAKRRKALYRRSALGGGAKGAMKGGGSPELEGRIDLTALPCVCVDARRTTFRDDAIGVRPRSSTGRKVVKAASKWEIMVHIADVSDVYSPMVSLEGVPAKVKDSLQSAAESRGLSRYDLPLGPLHLMPPVALEALALATESTQDSARLAEDGAVNRCVTVWAYIDERDGKVLDAGVERTLISAPMALDFALATSLLDGNDDGSLTPQRAVALSKAKAVLSVAERNLSLWSKRHRTTNIAARKREERMRVKELLAKETSSPLNNNHRRDDGGGGEYSFQRTRGHRLVDSALDLYGFLLSGLLIRSKVPIPRAPGSGADRGGRLGTAPLRRYIDGVSQRQALSVLCDFGGESMTKKQCSDASAAAARANDAMSNVRSVKVGARTHGMRQRDALRTLAGHLAGISGGGSAVKGKSVVPAIGTGRENEVAILGAGAIAKCTGVNGSLKSGERVSVEVTRLEPERGVINVRLTSRHSV